MYISLKKKASAKAGAFEAYAKVGLKWPDYAEQWLKALWKYATCKNRQAPKYTSFAESIANTWRHGIEQTYGATLDGQEALLCLLIDNRLDGVRIFSDNEEKFAEITFIDTSRLYLNLSSISLDFRQERV